MRLWRKGWRTPTWWLVSLKRSTGHTHTHTTAEHTTAEQTTHTNTERATAQRHLLVEVVVGEHLRGGWWVSTTKLPGLGILGLGLTRNMSLVFLWLRPRNTWIRIRHVGSTGHTHTHRQRTTPPTPTHTHTRQEQHPKPPNEHLPKTLNNARRWRNDGAFVSVNNKAPPSLNTKRVRVRATG